MLGFTPVCVKKNCEGIGFVLVQYDVSGAHSMLGFTPVCVHIYL